MSLIKLQVKAEGKKYPIFIGNNILNKLQRLLKENLISFNQCLVVADNKVPKKLIIQVLNSFPKKKYSFTTLLPVKKIKTKKVLIIFCLYF